MVDLSEALVRDRWSALLAPGALDALRTACEARVMRTAWMEHGYEEHHLVPYGQQTSGMIARLPLDGPEPGAVEVGLDDRDRAVVVVEDDGLRLHLVTRSALGAERVEVRAGELRDLELLACDHRGRPFRLMRRLRSSKGNALLVRTRIVFDTNDRPALALDLYDGGHANATRFVHDSQSGELVRVEDIILPGTYTGEEEQAFANAIGAVDTAYAETTWDVTIHGREPQRPDPARAFEGLAAPLADAIATALEAVREPVGPLAWVRVTIAPQLRPALPSLVSASAAGVVYRDRVRDLADEPRHVPITYDGPATPQLDVLGACSPELRRRIRAGVQALSVCPEARACQLAFEQSVQLGTELAAALDSGDWGPTDAAFLPLVETLQDQVSADRFATTRAVVGDARIDAFVASIAPSPDDPVRLLGDDLRLADRGALAALLRDVGLSDVDAARVSDDAAWAIVLEPGGDGESRLGGPPVLAAGVPWPAAHGRPLTHLATIALHELPDVEGRDVLPAAGHLGFFVDFSDEGDFCKPIGPSSPTPELVRIVYVPPGAETYEPEIPNRSDQVAWVQPPLVQRRVRPVARLQIRDLAYGFYGEMLPGLDEPTVDLVSRLRRPINGDIEHQMLGYPDVAQGDPRGAPTDVAVFHIGCDSDLDFDIYDGGDVLVFGDVEDVRAGRWERLTVSPSSA